MTGAKTSSNVTAPTLLVEAGGQRYAYRRFGTGSARPLLLLQHFTGTLDNWDPAVTDPLACSREVILFDNAGVGRSAGTVPTTIADMAQHVLSFLGALKLESCDVLGYFAPTESSQAAGAEFVARLAQRKEDRDPVSGPQVARAQVAAFREWEHFEGERFADLRHIRQPTLVVNGIHDEMIPVANSYWLSQNLPDAVLMTYPDSGHGSLFQFHESFIRQASAFLDSKSAVAPY